jgi:hypothetical protein
LITSARLELKGEDVEFLPQPIPNLEDERAFELLFSQLQNLARATRDRARFAEPKEGTTREEIELRAYQIFEGRGGLHGHDVEDWSEAERQLLAEHSPPDLQTFARIGSTSI